MAPCTLVVGGVSSAWSRTCTVAVHVAAVQCGVSAVRDAAHARAAVYLTADDVIAATRDTMEATLDYLAQKYGDIDNYAREARALQARSPAARQARLLAWVADVGL
jgi:hypothetical protein